MFSLGLCLRCSEEQARVCVFQGEVESEGGWKMDFYIFWREDVI